MTSIIEVVYSENEVENICISQSDLRLENRVHMDSCPHGLSISILFPVQAVAVISAVINKGLKAPATSPGWP